MSRGRLVFDLTSAARWSGPPVGIVRAQRELARWAARRRPDLVFALFDPRSMQYRAVSDRLADAFIAGRASLDAWSLPDPTGARRRRSAWLPGWAYSALQSRRTALRLLERVRLAEGRPRLSRLADRLQRPLISPRHRAPMVGEDGGRRDFLTPDMVFGPPIVLSSDDTLFCAGFGWSHSNMAAILATKAQARFRLVVLCYDIIPLLRPDFFKPRDVEDMRRYWALAFAGSDQIIVNALAVAGDVRGYCQSEGMALAPVCVRSLGASPGVMQAEPGVGLPAGLEAERFALFVSTLEPRKGHDMLYRVWLRLLDEGIPQAHGFKLVFVGRAGWMTEALAHEVRTDPRVAGSLLMLDRVSDSELDRLYRDAAFCLYPSQMEGYGLPVVEAFSRGKAVLVSAGGALEEIAKDYSPTLPSRDGEAWYDALKRWIREPAMRQAYETAIRERFRHPSWDEAAAGIFEAASQPQSASAAA